MRITGVRGFLYSDNVGEGNDDICQADVYQVPVMTVCVWTGSRISGIKVVYIGKKEAESSIIACVPQLFMLY